jgi:hypothetical protein
VHVDGARLDVRVAPVHPVQQGVARLADPAFEASAEASAKAASAMDLRNMGSALLCPWEPSSYQRPVRRLEGS